MPKDSSRPFLATSSTEFALPPSTSNPVASSSSLTLDDTNFALPRFRRPSLLAPKAGYLSDSRLHSPLAASFTLHSSAQKRKEHHHALASDEFRMRSDSSPSSSSENTSTPPLIPIESGDEDSNGKGLNSSKAPLTPPRKSSTASTEDSNGRYPKRRLSFPVKQPRILNLVAESRPVENEVRSEAAFQRLLASGSDAPMYPRTPRAPSDRGRYPEEAGEEEYQREDTPSDDEDENDDGPFAFYATGGSEPINIVNARTPAGSVNGDDQAMSISESPSFGSVPMDVDVSSGSPAMSSVSSIPLNHWRYTPPPTTSAVRSNKRKFDDRFDPYANASKRRAVSPSISYLRESHSVMGSPISRNNPRLPISIPVNVPGSTVSSAASSPTITGSYPISLTRPGNAASSPTLRASMALGSPILRPVPRATTRRGEEEEREIDGAGEAVGGLSLG